jgi:hypothetical protein
VREELKLLQGEESPLLDDNEERRGLMLLAQAEQKQFSNDELHAMRTREIAGISEVIYPKVQETPQQKIETPEPSIFENIKQVSLSEIQQTWSSMTSAEKVDIVADLTPIVGDAKGLVEGVVTGSSIVTQKPLEWWERAISTLSAVPVLGTPADVLKVLDKWLYWLCKRQEKIFCKRILTGIESLRELSQNLN